MSRSDVSADKQKENVGGTHLFTVWCPRSRSDLLTSQGSCKNCEAGGRTTLETEIVTRRKHEICAHLLRCSGPKEMVTKENLDNAIKGMSDVVKMCSNLLFNRFLCPFNQFLSEQ